MSHEFIPKDTRSFGKVTGKTVKTKKQTENRKRRQRDKRINAAKRELVQREAEFNKWRNHKSFEDQWTFHLHWSKGMYEAFARRTGRTINFTQTHELIARRGQNVLDVVSEVSHVRRSWLILTPGNGHRPGLNQAQLTKICGKLGIKYWSEMRVNEMRAVLSILAWKENIDPRSDW